MPVQDSFSDLAERYNPPGEILRQIVSHLLVDRGLAEHLPLVHPTGRPRRTGFQEGKATNDNSRA
jgi:hypothetical protein